MGWPIRSIHWRTMCSAGSTTSAKVFSSISTTGSSTVTRVMVKLGRLPWSDSLAIWSISSWDGLPGM
ncbi:hypothetical protein D9M71_488550 [compost metagenome]